MSFDHFGLIAGLYDRTAQYIPSAAVLELLDLQPGGLLLDAGGGTGRVAQVLRKMVKEVVVLDYSRGMLSYAVRKGLAVTCSPAELIPFASGIFNRIIMVDAFHHVFDHHQVISEFWRVLEPGGKIVIVEPDIHKFAVKLVAIGERVLLMRSHIFPGEQIQNLLESLGARVQVIYNELSVYICAERVRQM